MGKEPDFYKTVCSKYIPKRKDYRFSAVTFGTFLLYYLQIIAFLLHFTYRDEAGTPSGQHSQYSCLVATFKTESNNRGIVIIIYHVLPTNFLYTNEYELGWKVWYVTECLKESVNLYKRGRGGGKRKKHGECLAFYTHLQGEQDLACSTNGSMAKPVAFAYWPTCHLRVKGQPTPNAAM